MPGEVQVCPGIPPHPVILGMLTYKYTQIGLYSYSFIFLREEEGHSV